MDKDSDINPTSAKQDVIQGLKMTKEAIDARLDDMVNTAMMSEAAIIDCFDMDKPYFNAAVCEIAVLISEETKRSNAGLPAHYAINDLQQMIGFRIMRAIDSDTLEAAEDSI